MLYGHDRTVLRRFFVQVLEKHQRGQALEPMERLVAAVLEQHPEYHRELADPQGTLDRDYPAEAGRTNPFLHMGMHLAIREQAGTDRPPGIAEAYRALCAACGDAHEAEHRIMECLGEALWDAQRRGVPPDERRYLVQVRRLAGLNPESGAHGK